MKQFGRWFRIAPAALVMCSGLTIAAGQTTYYVNPAGSDGNDGKSPSSPWQTVAKVNGSSLNPGDLVLFVRGGQWHESLIVPSSGTTGNPITFADYGSGAKPKFWGSMILDNTQFQALGAGIFTYPLLTPVYSVLADQGFFQYSFGQPASSIPGSWSYANGQIMLNSPNSDPRYDGRSYTAVERDDVVYSNYQNHLIFQNLVVDESARYDDNGGYGFRIMGSTDIQVTGCEAYHAGKHNFGVINSTQFIGKNLVAAYAAPGQQASGGASAYVTYGDQSTGMYSQTSEWHNISASNMDDPQDNTTYDAFVNHGSTVSSVWLDQLQSSGAGVTLANQDNPGAVAKITGGLIQNARLELNGSGLLADGIELSGALATVDVTSSNTILQNMLIHGTNLGSAWYQTAVLFRGTNDTLRFSTIDMDPQSWTNTDVALTSANLGFQMYGNILLAPKRIFAIWDQNLNTGSVSSATYNLYTPGSTFASFVGGPFQWVDLSLAQWQTFGFDLTSFAGNPMLINESGGNYQLSPGSPAIDAALLPTSLLQSIPLDKVSNSRLAGSAFDMGAYESVAAAVVTPMQQTSTTTVSVNNGILVAVVTVGSGSPTGSVSFYDGSKLLDSVLLSNSTASTAASLDTTQAHTITAVYSGDTAFQTSTSTPININPVVTAQNYPITLSYPLDGQTVSGVVNATAIITQNLDAAGSELWIDGGPLNDHRTFSPYTYSLDTNQLAPGPHTLQVWAHDIGNNNLLSNKITIIISR